VLIFSTLFLFMCWLLVHSFKCSYCFITYIVKYIFLLNSLSHCSRAVTSLTYHLFIWDSVHEQADNIISLACTMRSYPS
jgi:hypothetical protein